LVKTALSLGQFVDLAENPRAALMGDIGLGGAPMQSTPNPKQTDPPDVLVARADEELAHAYQQIARADEELARVDEQLSHLERDAARRRSHQPSRGGRALRGFTGLLLAAGIGLAAIAWQSPSGDAAKQIIARWAPQLVLTSSLPLEKPGVPAQWSPSNVQAAAAKAASPQPATLAQTGPEDVAPTAAALSPELAQLLQKMERDLATVGQGIEQLKTNQEQMARDNAKAAEQLKASQEQMARVIAKISEAKTSETKTSETKASEAKASEAKASEQNLRPRISAPPPRPTVTPTRKPVHTLPSPQARSQPQAGSRPQATMRRQAEPQSSSAPQPPTSER
jgi:hypothetical protein